MELSPSGSGDFLPPPLPDQSTPTTTPDTPVTTTNPDGSTTVTSQNPDGSTTQTTYYPDGTSQTTVTSPNSDGSTTQTTYNRDGTTSTTVNSPTGDGTVTTTYNAGGTTTTKVTSQNPDGSTTTTTYMPNGTTTTQTSGQNADGSTWTQTTDAQGKTTTTVQGQNPDGSSWSRTYNPDGTTTSKTTGQNSDGSTWTQATDAKGKTTTTITGQNSDGSTWTQTTTPDGRTTTTTTGINDDGTPWTKTQTSGPPAAALDAQGNPRTNAQGQPLYVGPNGQLATRDALDVMAKTGANLATDANGNLLTNSRTGEYLYLAPDGQAATRQALDQMARDGVNYALDANGETRMNNQGQFLVRAADGTVATQAALDQIARDGVKYALDAQGNIRTNDRGEYLIRTANGQVATKQSLDLAARDGVAYAFDANGDMIRDKATGQYYVIAPDGTKMLPSDIAQINARSDGADVWAARNALLALKNTLVVSPEILNRLPQLWQMMQQDPDQFRLPSGALPKTQADMLQVAGDLAGQLADADRLQQLQQAANRYFNALDQNPGSWQQVPVGQGSPMGIGSDPTTASLFSDPTPAADPLQQLADKLGVKLTGIYGNDVAALMTAAQNQGISANTVDQALQEVNLRQAAMDPNAPMPSGLDSNQQAAFNNIRATGDPNQTFVNIPPQPDPSAGGTVPVADPGAAPTGPQYNSLLDQLDAGAAKIEQGAGDLLNKIGQAVTGLSNTIGNTGAGLLDSALANLPGLSPEQQAALNEKAQQEFAQGPVQAVNAASDFGTHLYDKVVAPVVNPVLGAIDVGLANLPGESDALRNYFNQDAQAKFASNPLLQGMGNLVTAAALNLEASLDPSLSQEERDSLNQTRMDLLNQGPNQTIAALAQGAQNPGQVIDSLERAVGQWVVNTALAVSEGDAAKLGDQTGDLINTLMLIHGTVEFGGQLVDAAAAKIDALSGKGVSGAAMADAGDSGGLMGSLGPQVQGQAASESAAMDWIRGTAHLDDSIIKVTFGDPAQAAAQAAARDEVLLNKPFSAITPDDLASSPALQDKIYQQAVNLRGQMQALADQIIAETGVDADAKAILKRDDPSDFTRGILEKSVRKDYTTISQMDDIVRGRFNATNEQEMNAIVQALQQQTDYTVKLVQGYKGQPGEAGYYPRYHVILSDASTGMTFEWQIGTKALTELYETPGIKLPEGVNVGTDIHDVEYDVFKSIQDKDPTLAEMLGIPAFRQEVGQASYEALQGRPPDFETRIQDLNNKASNILAQLTALKGADYVNSFKH